MICIYYFKTHNHNFITYFSIVQRLGRSKFKVTRFPCFSTGFYKCHLIKVSSPGLLSANQSYEVFKYRQAGPAHSLCVNKKFVRLICFRDQDSDCTILYKYLSMPEGTFYFSNNEAEPTLYSVVKC